MFYEGVFKKLDQEQVEYVVVGGVALVLLGVIRLTADLDLFIELSETNLKKFIKVMAELGYKPKMPVSAEDLTRPEKRRQWKEEKGMLVFSFYHPREPMHLIDIFVDEPIPYETVKRGKKIATAKGIRVPVVSAEDLVRLKRISGRPQDLADIAALEELNGE